MWEGLSRMHLVAWLGVRLGIGGPVVWFVMSGLVWVVVPLVGMSNVGSSLVSMSKVGSGLVGMRVPQP